MKKQPLRQLRKVKGVWIDTVKCNSCRVYSMVEVGNMLLDISVTISCKHCGSDIFLAGYLHSAWENIPQGKHNTLRYKL